MSENLRPLAFGVGAADPVSCQGFAGLPRDGGGDDRGALVDGLTRQLSSSRMHLRFCSINFIFH